MKISIVIASNNKNLALAKQIKKIAMDMGNETQIIDLVAEDLPLYTPANQEKMGIPNSVKQLNQTITETEGMIFVAPEYNGGIPPSLTSAIAWLSVSSEDWRGCFNGKPAAIATHSGGGGQNVLFAMRNQLSYIGMNVVGRTILTNGGKPFNPESAQEVIKQLVKWGN
ncbi:MAG: NADPH-dependent FMN reductase [Cyanobacterium sp.]